MAAVVIALSASSLIATGSANAAQQRPAVSHDTTIPNLGLVRQQIQVYYGDKGDHVPAPDSAYAADVARVQHELYSWLSRNTSVQRRALVLDVDDTVLSSYTYGATHEFGGYSSTGPFLDYVLGKRLTAVFGMTTLTKWAADHGYAIFYITGRPTEARDITLQNLAEQGYNAPTELFTKPGTANLPPYLPCAASCSTIQYKAGTRAHLKSLGYDIVANVGDQLSDLDGGHARRSFKVPNPMYYLP
ncbi:HAD family acid phosphatase [Actinoplanes sp. NPDC000266]